MKLIQYFEQDLRISNTETCDTDAKIVVLRGGLGEKKEYMDSAVSDVVQNNPYNEFTEIHLDNPWVRVIIFGINGLDYQEFKNADGLKSYLKNKDGR